MRHGKTRNPYVQTWTQWCQACYSENTITKGVTHKCGCGAVLYRNKADTETATKLAAIHQATT